MCFNDYKMFDTGDGKMGRVGNYWSRWVNFLIQIKTGQVIFWIKLGRVKKKKKKV